MVPTSPPSRFLSATALVVALAWFTPSLSAQSPVLSADLTPPTVAEKPERLEDIRRQAREAEKRGDWLKACWRYDEILRRDRGNVEAREAYHRCLRRHQITTRHGDRGYRDLLAGLVPSQALDVYEQVLHAVRPRFVERDRADYGTLFKHGLTELRYALEDEVFLREHLSDVPPNVIQEFRALLKKWSDRRLSTTLEAREQVNAVLKAGYRIGIPDRPALTVVVALEFASGACSGLDEYTFFFDPSSFGDLVASSRIKYAGIGAELVSIDGQIYISRVQQNSPAAAPVDLTGALIRRIDGMEVANLPAYYVAERLRGEVDSTVELVVVGRDQMEATVRLVRRPVGTVDWYVVEERTNDMPMPTEIGYLRISNFQESTPQEVREALAQLQTSGIKGLILDLRGNPGGLFKSAVKVSELFLPEGSLVVLTQGTVKDFDQPFRATGMNPFALPMVVLVDGETASAAEVLAGGLKEQGRARLIGQTTFGKGSIQQFILLDKSPLQKTPGGIRITVAKFYWPGRSPDGGRGIVPHDFAGPDTRTLIEAATRHLRTVTGMMMMPRQ